MATLRQIGNALVEFLSAAAAYRSEHCRLPRIWRAGSQGQGQGQGLAGTAGNAGASGGETPGAGAEAAAAGAGEGGGSGSTEGEDGKADAGPKQEQQAERPPLKRPACFRWVCLVFGCRRGWQARGAVAVLRARVRNALPFPALRLC